MPMHPETFHRLQVTAALIPVQDRLFIAQRPAGKKFALMWEFPGGKVEPGESLEGSLVREIAEELCWQIRVRAFFRTVPHIQPGLAVDLHTFWCSIDGGELCLREHIAFRWVHVHELSRFGLTEADRKLVAHLEELHRLPLWNAAS
jgi:8-oxo-dGTP diphosphatase